MSISSEFNIEQFHQLILNASSYMTKIESFSFKIVNSNLQVALLYRSVILRCLSMAELILLDQYAAIIKKLFVLRFVKDTLILASLSFYEGVMVKIMPWIITASKICENNALEKRIEMMGKLLRGGNEMMNSDATVCKTILQLVEEMIKWMGTNIKDHPYSKITFRSCFRLLLEKLPRIQNVRVTDLTFFKADDPSKYQAYYIERDSGEAEGERLNEYIQQMVPMALKGQKIEDLEAMVETGDFYVISSVIEEFQGLLEDVTPKNVLSKLPLVLQIHRMMAIGQVEIVNLIKEYLLQKVVMIALILHHHREENKEGAQQLNKIVSMIKSWNTKCQALLLPVQSFRQISKLFERQGISCIGIPPAELDYKPRLGFTFDINKDKLNKIDCNEAEVIKKIRMCKYIPAYESIAPHKSDQSESQNQDFLSSHKSASRHSKQSNNSLNKRQFLQAFSKFPQLINQVKSNSSEMKQIYLQHSNLSDRFNLINNPTQSNQKNLILSFKKTDKEVKQEPQSPQMVFTDSFTSNQKNFPHKLVSSKDYAEHVNQPSMEIYSQNSLKESKSQRVVLSHHSSSKPQSNQQSKVSDNPQSRHFNDYMLPQSVEPSEKQRSNKASKEVSKIKKQKSSSLARSQKRGFFKSTSRDKMAFTPISRISNSKSINILQFNQAEYPVEQRYTPPTPAKVLPPAEQIKVERTIQKPKFGFKAVQESIATEKEQKIDQQSFVELTLSKDSISSLQSQLQDSRSLGSVPDNFMDLLKAKPEQIKVNAFQGKVKQLQKKIQKMKEKKEQVVKEVIEKQMIIQKMKQEMPLPKYQLELENEKLKKAIMQPKKIQKTQSQFKQEQTYEIKGVMKHIAVTPLREEIKKQLLYSKCRLYKGQPLQVGFQVKNKEISLYFAFLASVEECTVKVEANSLVLSEEIDAKIYKLAEGKQIKFKSAIKDYQLFSGEFQLATLVIKLQNRKNTDNIQLSLPFHLYNMYQFIPPRFVSSFARVTDWHFCCPALLANPHYITDFFPQTKNQGNIFTIRAEIESKASQIRVIIENDKFAIEFEGLNQHSQLKLVRCVLALLQHQR